MDIKDGRLRCKNCGHLLAFEKSKPIHKQSNHSMYCHAENQKLNSTKKTIKKLDNLRNISFNTKHLSAMHPTRIWVDMRRIAVLAVLLTISVLVGTEVIGVAEANPVPWASTPNLEKPTLTIHSPQNNTEYNSSMVLNFTVTKPDSWNAVHMFSYYVGAIHSVDVFLDGNHVYCEREGPNYSANLTLASSGPHFLNITVLGYTYYRGAIYNNCSLIAPIHDEVNINGVTKVNTIYEYPRVVSDTVNFTVDSNDVINPAPSPTIPEFPVTGILWVFAVASVSLVYLKRRKGKP
jgi:hypothetical protein